MVKLIGGDLYQWDTGRIAVVRPDTDAVIHEVHFTNKNMSYAYVVSTYEKDGVVLVAIPNAILQQENNVICYEITKTDSGEMTVAQTDLTMHKRNKPQDYAYTEGELKNFDRLETLIPSKLSQLEQDVELGASDYNTLENIPIRNVSSDEGNMVAICELESGVYRFSGAFTPYHGSNIYYNFSKNQLVNIITASAGTHVQAFYPDDNTVQFCAIMRDGSASSGWTVDEKDVCLNDLQDFMDTIGDISNYATKAYVDTLIGGIENGSY